MIKKRNFNFFIKIITQIQPYWLGGRASASKEVSLYYGGYENPSKYGVSIVQR